MGKKLGNFVESFQSYNYPSEKEILPQVFYLGKWVPNLSLGSEIFTQALYDMNMSNYNINNMIIIFNDGNYGSTKSGSLSNYINRVVTIHFII